jgi:histidine ammonia-lyase
LYRAFARIVLVEKKMEEQPVTLIEEPSPHEILRDLVRVASGSRVRLASEAREMLSQRRKQVADFVDQFDEPAYGFNRGFGHNVHLKVDPDKRNELQVNLIRSHSCGVGEPAPSEVVRGAMFLRAVSLARGYSGVRPEVVEQLVDLLNADIVPVVPRLGSVSASGDLAPLSHIALALLGEGEVIWRGQRQSAKTALDANGIAPLQLEMKEGLALNNGVQYSTAYGVWCLERMDRLLKTAVIASALSAQVMLGADTPFRKDLHRLRPHRGSVRVAGWLFNLMSDSPLRESHRRFDVDGEIQDPYNIRCAPQILGACADLLERARETFATEAASVTDNPIILKAGAEFEKAGHNSAQTFLDHHVDIVSGGHFHGMPIAIDIYGMLQACAIMGRLSNMRAVRYVDGHRNKGLGGDLKWHGSLEILEKWEMVKKWADDNGTKWPDDFQAHIDDLRRRKEDIEKEQAISSALMIPEYVSASLTNWIWGSCMPVHLFSLSTDAGQEDHVSMAANVVTRLHDTLPRLAEVLAIELAYAAQAAALRKQMRCIPSRLHHWHPLEADQLQLNAVGEAILTEVGRIFPLVERDRPMADNISRLGDAVLDGTIIRAAESAGFAFAQ